VTPKVGLKGVDYLLQHIIRPHPVPKKPMAQNPAFMSHSTIFGSYITALYEAVKYKAARLFSD
jgi:hypothetical protein